MVHVLVVDDDPSARSALTKLLSSEGHVVDVAESGAAALAVAFERAPDVVLTDVKMPRMDGLELMKKLHERHPRLPVIVTSGVTELSAAVAAMRAGAADYLPKPIDFDALLLVIERVMERRSPEPAPEPAPEPEPELELEPKSEPARPRSQAREQAAEGLHGHVGVSPAMQKVYSVARRVAGSRATVLLTGESGTGKGELARAIHALSPRADKPFIALHCAALPATLLESELFGHEKGSFTGADRRRLGRFEQASGGTLFLDEVGEIPPPMQVKLLRVLQERTFERVGGNDLIHTDVRIIAATNKDLAAEVAAGRFREDLFYRLNVVAVEMPPLRMRGNDAMILAEHFLAKFACDNQKSLTGFSEAARAKIARCPWQGNVRALENAIERAVVLACGARIEADDLPFQEEGLQSSEGIRIPGSSMRELERHAIIKTFEACERSTTRAAEVLGISVRTIQYRLHEYGMARSARS